MIRWLTTIAVLIGAALIAPLTNTVGPISVLSDRAELEFPDRLTFDVSLKGETGIERVVLEYGVDQLTCGTVVAKAFPDVQPGSSVTAAWTWEMKQTGSQPPGSKVWWQWRVTDAQGNEFVTERRTVTWLDDQHTWQSIDGDSINLHWYGSPQSFGRELHDSAVKSLNALTQETGLRPDRPIDLYIYATVQDMRDAILYEPGWTGGLAYPDHDIVIIGISPDQIDWGKRTQAHELTHVLVGQLTFSCLSDIPTWLQEGLAVYGEGGPEAASRNQLEKAIADNQLVPVRSLSGNFSEDPAKADLSYSQSYSLVNFLIEQFGQDKMLELLRALRDGATVDDALRATYHFDIEGFEDAWRAHIGAQARPAANQRPTVTPIPTEVPTFVPVSVAQAGPTIAPTRARPTPTPIAVAKSNPALPAESSTSSPTTTPTIDTPVIVVIVLGLIVLLALALVIIGRRQHRMKL
jgi:hypothetical protein